MLHPRFAPALATTMVLIGGSVFAIAQMGPNDARRLPYQGYLESGGVPAETGTYNLRFGLFSTAGASTDCLLNDPTTCSLWGEEQEVEVSAGNFSVVLGDSESLTDTVMNQDALFLGIAVNGPEDGATFTALGSKQEILAVPFAARAAAARDYKVTGTITAETVATTDLTADDADVVTLSATTANIDSLRLSTGGADIRLENEGASNGVALRALTNPASGEPIFRVLSSGNAERLRVEHDGEVLMDNNLTVEGNATINGAISYECGSGWTRVGRYCIENTLRGATSGSNYTQASNICHDVGAGICPIDALLACDVTQPSGALCSNTTDDAQWLWTSTIDSTNDGDAFSNLQIFSGNGNNSINEVDVVSSSNSTAAGGVIRVFCCRPAGGL